MDGQLTEPGWKKALTIGSLVLTSSGKQPEENSKVRLLVNGGNLFIGTEFDDKDTGKLIANHKVRDTSVWRDDCLEFFADAKQYDLPKTVKSLQTPLMVVHGDADEIIPVQDAYLAKTLNPEYTELVVIPGADHMFSAEMHRSQTSKLVVKWFKEHLHGPL